VNDLGVAVDDEPVVRRDGAGGTERLPVPGAQRDLVLEGRAGGRGDLRGALAPAITLAGLSVPALITGSVLVESVFGWPGMGRVAYEAIFARDYNVITAVAVEASVPCSSTAIVAP
jgi:hypothetical protein